MKSLRANLGRGRAFIGPFLAIPSPMVVEIASAAQPDFVCIDQEHSAITADMLENMLRAAAIHGVPALVRVPSAEPSAIARALDGGADGVLVPHVSTAADARAAVAAARFAPEGHRGAGPGRSAGYGRTIGQAIERARRDTLVAIQIETAEALDHLDAILAVPGVDLALVGPGDLGLSLEAAGKTDPEALADAIKTVVTGARTAGIPVGIFCMTRSEAEQRAKEFDFVICGSDTTLLIAGFDETFAALPQ